MITKKRLVTDNAKSGKNPEFSSVWIDGQTAAMQTCSKTPMVRKVLRSTTPKFIARRLSPENGHRLPALVSLLAIDEFADLIMTAGKEVEAPITRLAQLAEP
ncbi:MAG: hypothetical protein U5L09_03200 [Bacteroidales bacterium]|nr:hypothetical protein [Bacteroidales bacterium]